MLMARPSHCPTILLCSTSTKRRQGSTSLAPCSPEAASPAAGARIASLDRAAFDEALFRLFGQHLINCLLHPHAKIHAVRRKVSGGETYRHYLPS
jgi:hypothetical protein